MRVLHVTDAYLPRVGGIEMHVHDLARAQMAAGDDVAILTLTRSQGAASAPVGSRVLRPGDRAQVWDKAAFLWRHRKLGELEGFDVVHTHCSTMSPLSYATLGSARIPTLMTVHSLWRRYTAFYRAADYALGWSKWPVSWSAVSHTAADAVRRAAARPLDVAVLPNGVDLDAWQPVPRDPDGGHLRMLSVMRLAARKRPMPLLRILRSVRAAVPETTRVTATIVGEGPQRESMEKYLRRHGMTEWVRLTGHLPRPEIAQVMARSDVFVAPAILESFGIAALEARACGLPVVGRLGTGLSDFIGPEDGVLVDSDRAMAHALAGLATRPLVADGLDRAALASMSWASVVDRTRELYVAAGARDLVSSGVQPGRRQAS
ncbi:MAG: glycosyltransferase family 4 protein [Frankiales bacterium]|nr:glycosyltransferase family 4 protein [Frankiales bacterium]